jgi:hypothetical protein
MLVRLAEAFGTSVTELVVAALGEKAVDRGDLSERATLEVVKRFTRLSPNAQRGVLHLVHSLDEGA